MLSSKTIYGIIRDIQAERNAKGSFFSARNLKKDGSVRTWSCRLGVSKYLTGFGAPFNAAEKNFITVWDPNAKGPIERKYRQLNITTLEYLRVCGEVIVEDGVPTPVYYKYAR